MAFTVEDGTGVADANAYITVAQFDTYFTERGNATAVALTVDQKQHAIIKATDYVEMRYSSRFRGTALTTTQALSFPRTATGYAEMPVQLTRAVAEYALRAHSAPLAPDLTVDATGRTPTKMVRKVGPIDKEDSYATRGERSIPMEYKPYPAADGLIKSLLLPTGGVFR